MVMSSARRATFGTTRKPDRESEVPKLLVPRPSSTNLHRVPGPQFEGFVVTDGSATPTGPKSSPGSLTGRSKTGPRLWSDAARSPGEDPHAMWVRRPTTADAVRGSGTLRGLGGSGHLPVAPPSSPQAPFSRCLYVALRLIGLTIDNPANPVRSLAARPNRGRASSIRSRTRARQPERDRVDPASPGSE